MDLHPCKEYSEERIYSLFAGRHALTPQEIAELDIPQTDRIWVLIHAFMDPVTCALYTCDCAEHACKKYNIDTEAIIISRNFLETGASLFQYADPVLIAKIRQYFATPCTDIADPILIAKYKEYCAISAVFNVRTYAWSYMAYTAYHAVIVDIADKDWEIKRALYQIERSKKR